MSGPKGEPTQILKMKKNRGIIMITKITDTSQVGGMNSKDENTVMMCEIF